MGRPVFAMITINQQHGLGPRYVTAATEAAGVETHLIHFKLFHSRHVSREESRRLSATVKGAFVARVHPHGDELVPYPQPVTDTEMDLLIGHLGRIAPTVVGISFTSVDVATAERITRAVRDRLCATPVIWGGIHATLNPESSIAVADVVCVGEGDESLVEHLSAPGRRDIAGLWFRDGDQVWRNPTRPLIQDLDRLPFPTFGGNEIIIDSDRVNEETRDPARAIELNYSIITARGCPFACNYCLHSALRAMYPRQKYLRRRSVDNVMAELRLRTSQGPISHFIPFYDEVFVKDEPWIQEFAARYEREIALPFAGYGHYRFSTASMLQALKRAGMHSTTVAFQSGSPRMLKDVYNRPTDLDQLVAWAQVVYDVQFDLFVAEGLTNSPFETEDDCRATLELLLRLPQPFYLQMFKLAIFPGTVISGLTGADGPVDEEMFRFWNMMYLLPQSGRLPAETIRALSHDACLRAAPALLEDLADALHPEDRMLALVDDLGQRAEAMQRDRFPQRFGARQRGVASRLKSLPRAAVDRMRRYLGMF